MHDFVDRPDPPLQEAGGSSRTATPSAEAWIFIAVGLLGTIGRRVGGLLHDDLASSRSAAAG